MDGQIVTRNSRSEADWLINSEADSPLWYCGQTTSAVCCVAGYIQQSVEISKRAMCPSQGIEREFQADTFYRKLVVPGSVTSVSFAI